MNSAASTVFLVYVLFLVICSCELDLSRGNVNHPIVRNWVVDFNKASEPSRTVSNLNFYNESLLFAPFDTLYKIRSKDGLIEHKVALEKNHWLWGEQIVIKNDRVIAFSGFRDLVYCFNLSDLSLIWKKQFPGQDFAFRNSIYFDETYIWRGFLNGTLSRYTYNGEHTESKYISFLDNSIQRYGDHFLTYGGQRVEHRDSTFAYIVKRDKNMNPVWVYRTKNASSLASGPPLLIEGNRIWAGFDEGPSNSPAGELVCLNGDDGSVIWKQLGWFENVALDGPNVFAHRGTGIQGFDKITGAEKWRVPYSGDGMSGLAAANGKVFATHGDLHVYDAETGELLYSYRAHDGGFFVDLHVQDGVLYATTSYSLYSFEIRE